MLALVLDDDAAVIRAQELFEKLDTSVLIISAGSPSGNGHVRSKQSAAIVVFDLREHVSDTVQEKLRDMQVFNLSPRQAEASVKKRCGFFRQPDISSSAARAQTWICVRYHIRMAGERVRMIPLLRNRPKGSSSSSCAQAVAAIEIAAKIKTAATLQELGIGGVDVLDAIDAMDNLAGIDSIEDLLPDWLI